MHRVASVIDGSLRPVEEAGLRRRLGGSIGLMEASTSVDLAELLRRLPLVGLDVGLASRFQFDELAQDGLNLIEFFLDLGAQALVDTLAHIVPLRLQLGEFAFDHRNPIELVCLGMRKVQDLLGQAGVDDLLLLARELRQIQVYLPLATKSLAQSFGTFDVGSAHSSIPSSSRWARSALPTIQDSGALGEHSLPPIAFAPGW